MTFIGVHGGMYATVCDFLTAVCCQMVHMIDECIRLLLRTCIPDPATVFVVEHVDLGIHGAS